MLSEKKVGLKLTVHFIKLDAQKPTLYFIYNYQLFDYLLIT